ncbi:MAG: hypothetical protein Q8896_13745, partial [Bacteroidota bacterium]|nr:hypothetical protein [Bacteroidota bacterium]
MRSFRLFHIGVFFLLIANLNSCSNSSGSAPTTLSIPGVGSTFVFHHYDVDSSGRMIDSTQAFDTITVTGRELSYMGKTHVTQLTSARGHTLYTNLETNGDFSEYVQSQGQPGDKSGWF